MDFELLIIHSINFLGTDNENIISDISLLFPDYFKYKSYGKEVERLYITIICDSYDKFNKSNVDKARYSKKRRMLEYGIKIDHEKVTTIDKNMVQKLLLEEIIDSFKFFKEKKISDFDVENLKNDLKKLFKAYNKIIDSKNVSIKKNSNISFFEISVKAAISHISSFTRMYKEYVNGMIKIEEFRHISMKCFPSAGYKKNIKKFNWKISEENIERNLTDIRRSFVDFVDDKIDIEQYRQNMEKFFNNHIIFVKSDEDLKESLNKAPSEQDKFISKEGIELQYTTLKSLIKSINLLKLKEYPDSVLGQFDGTEKMICDFKKNVEESLAVGNITKEQAERYLVGITNSCDDLENIEDETKKEDSDFFNTVLKGDVYAIKKMIKEGADVNEKDYDGKSILINAVDLSLENKIIKLLIENGADVNGTTDYGSTPLMFASLQEDLSIIRTLIKNGADVNIQNEDRENALMFALQDLNPWNAKLLIKAGTDPNARDNLGRTALMMTFNDELVELLIKHGADVNIKDNEGRTALMRAKASEQDYIVELLKKAGAKE